MVYPREANLSEQTEVQPFKIALTLLLKGNLADLEPLGILQLVDSQLF